MKRKVFNKIIINATNIGERSSGIGIYSLNILKELAKIDSDIKFEVYLNRNSKKHIDKIIFPGNFIIKWVTKYVSPDYNFIGHFLRLIYSNLISVIKKNEIFFNTSQLEVSFFNRNQVVMIHDVIPLLFPHFHKKQYFYFKRLLKIALHKTKIIITPSSHTKELIKKIYNIPLDKVQIIPNGIPDHFFRKLPDIPISEKYILYAGRICPMKNIHGVFEAFNKLRDRIPHNLVFIGGEEKEFRKEIKKGRLSKSVLDDDRIIIKGYVEEDEINILMRGASVFIFPSFYEGFGLPPLEAMASGTPVVVSSSASLPEVCGDAAHYVKPDDINDISEGIMKVIGNKDYSRYLIDKGKQRIKQFRWDLSAKSVLNLILSEMIPLTTGNQKLAKVNHVEFIKRPTAQYKSTVGSG